MAAPGRMVLLVHGEVLAVGRDPEPDAFATIAGRSAAGRFTAVVCRGDETTWIGPAAAAPACARLEPGWRAIEVEGTLDFGLVGILAALAGTLAAAGVSIFAVSTFDTDVLLVKQERLEDAIAALVAAGHEVHEIG